MRKISTKEIKEKKETRSRMIIGIILVSIMILSTAGYSFFSGSQDETKKIRYNGIEFVKGDIGWEFEIQGNKFLTQYNPEETENITVPVYMTLGSYSAKPLYFVGENSGKQEIARNLAGYASRVLLDVCIEEEDYKRCDDENLPIKNCSQENIIITGNSENVEIKQNENCIFIFAPYQEQTRTADAFLFGVLGV